VSSHQQYFLKYFTYLWYLRIGFTSFSGLLWYLFLE